MPNVYTSRARAHLRNVANARRSMLVCFKTQPIMLTKIVHYAQIMPVSSQALPLIPCEMLTRQRETLLY